MKKLLNKYTLISLVVVMLTTALFGYLMYSKPQNISAALIYGNALQFNGTSSYARRHNSSTSNNNFSMTAWVYVNAYTAGSALIFQNGANDARGMTLFITSAGVLHADYAFVGDVNSGFTLNTGTWYHIALIRNSGTSQLYVNGGAQGSTSASTPNAAGSGDYITIGAWTSSGGTTTGFANVKVDDARFYERAISTGELSTLYTNGNTWPYTDISSTSLKYWYKFDETSGTNAADSTATGYDLTTTGTPTWVQGIVATGGSVDGGSGSMAITGGIYVLNGLIIK